MGIFATEFGKFEFSRFFFSLLILPVKIEI